MTTHEHTEHGRSGHLRHLTVAFAALSTLSLSVLAGTVGLVGTAGAQGGAAPITDYATYPAPLPPLCPQGGGALQGLSFDNGRGDTASSLGDLDVRHGDTVTMSWTGYHSGCVDGSGAAAVTVGLAAYDNPTLRFDPTVDEELQDGWQACGPDAAACTKVGGRYQLSVTVPGTEVCNVQLDSFLGLPLAVVGPNGSFYSDTMRGHGTNRLISAANFGLEPCAPPTTTSTTAAPVVTTAPPAPEQPAAPEQPPVTTAEVRVPENTEAPAMPPASEGPSTPVTEAPAAPQAPATPATATPTTAAPTTTIKETKVLNETATRLPFTGSDTFGLLRLATWLATAGVGTLLAATVLRHRRQSA